MKDKTFFISGGGDNHAIWAMHYLHREKTIMVLINSDVSTDTQSGSFGGILNFNTDEFIEQWPKIQNGEFETEEWYPLEIEIDGRIMIVGSEVFLGEREAPDYSGNFIQYGSKSYRHAGSGTLIASTIGTAPGSWFDAATHHIRDRKFPAPDSSRNMFLCNLSQNRGRPDPEFEEMVALGADIELTVTSMNDCDGIVRVDSIKTTNWTVPFPERKIAKVRVSKTPIKILKNPIRYKRL